MERGLYGSLAEGRKKRTIWLKEGKKGERHLRIIAWREGSMAHWSRGGKKDPMAK